MQNTSITQLNELLTIICDKLQLPPSLYEEAEKHYETVGSWLATPGSSLSNWKPMIYPQGSARIGTTTKPIGRDEYDVDLVCELLVDYCYVSPEAILKKVEKRLRDNKLYASMLEPKKRCVRLTYAKRFHLDILPAAPEIPLVGTRVRVPDRELKEWKASDPKGYAAWFEQRSGLYLPVMETKTEPLPDHESTDEKTPLQMAVQLIKRWRDIAFDDNPDDAPRSIVLTTLAGNAYWGELTVVDAFQTIVARILADVQISPRPLRVLNPANPEEVLSEKWEENPTIYGKFVQRFKQLEERWQDLSEARGLQQIQEIFTELFGEKVTSSALQTYAEKIGEARTSGNLHVVRSTGALAIGASQGTVQVQPNIFYGEE